MNRWTLPGVVTVLCMAACASPKDDGLYTITGRIDLPYDRTCCGPDSVFRMALMVVPADGERIEDYFYGLPVPTNPRASREVKPGNRRIPAVTLRSSMVEGLPAFLERFPDFPDLPGLRAFAEDFPEFMDHEFELTYKSFEGDSFTLENAPIGRYYIWLQTPFDGNRYFHAPVMREPTSSWGRRLRMDIRVEDWREVFFHL